MRYFVLCVVAGITLLATEAPVWSQGKVPPPKKAPDPTIDNQNKAGGKTLAEWLRELHTETLKEPIKAGSSDPSVMENAIRTLILYGPDAQKAVPDLIKGLTHKDSSVRVNSAIALGFIGFPSEQLSKGLTHLGKVLQDDSQTIVRYQVAMALARLGPQAKEAIPALINASNEIHCWEVRKASTYALSTVGYDDKEKTGPDMRCIWAMVERLKDACMLVRMEAAMGLMLIGVPGQPGDRVTEKSRLMQAIQAEKDKSVASWIRVAYLQIELPRDKKTPLSAEAQKELKDLGKALKPPTPMAARVQAGRALYVIGAYAKNQVPDLVEALGDKELMVVGFAAMALGQVGPEARGALPSLERLTQHTDESIRIEAQAAIRKIKGEAPKPVVKP